MQFNCPKCQTRLSSTPELAGQVVSCPDCGANLRMPAPKKPTPVRATPVKKITQPVAVQPKQSASSPPAPNPAVYQAHVADQKPTYQNPYQKKSKGGGSKIWLWVGGACVVFILVGGGIGALIFTLIYQSSRQELQAELKRPVISPIERDSLDRSDSDPEPTASASESLSNPPVNSGYNASTGELAKLAYTFPSNQSVHYKYKVSTEIESKQLAWSGHLTMSASNSMQIRKPERAAEPNLSNQGQGLAIAPHLIITGQEWVEGTGSIVVSHKDKSSTASKVGQVNIKSFPGVGLAILRTEQPICSTPCFDADSVDADQFPINSTVTAVYRDSSGQLRTQPLKINGFGSTRGRDGKAHYHFLHTSTEDKSAQLPSGSIVVTPMGQVAGIVAHVADKAMNSTLVITLSEFEEQNVFASNGIDQPTPTARPASNSISDLKPSLEPAVVDINVQRKPTLEEETADILPSQMIQFQDRRKVPNLLRSNNRHLAYFGSDSGEFQLVADGTILNGNANLLPLALGTPCDLVMPPLNPATDHKWEVTYPLDIIEDENSSRNSIRHFRRPRMRTRSVGAITRSFTASRGNQSNISIREVFVLRTTIGLSMDGTADYSFDTNERCMRMGNFTGSFVMETDRITIRIPVKYTFDRMTAAEYEPLVSAERAKEEKLNQRREVARAENARELTDDEIQQIVLDLDNPQKRMQTLRSLGSKRNDQTDKRISAKLRDLAAMDPKTASWLRTPAVRWLSDDDFMDLVDNMHAMNSHQKGLIFHIAKERKIEFAAENLIKSIDDDSYIQAGFYLRALDESREIEKLILAELRSIFDSKQNRGSKKVQCLVSALGTHGSEPSLLFLKKISDQGVAPKPHTSLSISKIESRGNSNAPEFKLD